MRLIAIPALLLAAAAAPVAAQPITANACYVTIARAPEDVRQVIEAWVAAEPHCTTMLEVRVVPTDGGYYLLARTLEGRVHERIVPDAQAAGVLVASWAADDGALAPIQPLRSIEQTALDAVRDVPTSNAPGEAPLTLSVRLPERRLPSWRQLTLGFGGRYSNNVEAIGARAEIDVAHRGAWILSAAGEASLQTITAYGANGVSASFEGGDLKLMAIGGYTLSSGRWHVRPAIGLGVVHSNVTGTTEMFGTFTDYNGSVESPVIEASVLVSRDVGDNWAITGGPVATYVSQTFEQSTPTFQRSQAWYMLFGGVRYRL